MSVLYYLLLIWALWIVLVVLLGGEETKASENTITGPALSTTTHSALQKGLNRDEKRALA